MDLVKNIIHTVETKTLLIIGIIILFGILEYVLRLSKFKISKEYISKKEKSERFGDVEKDMIAYYKRNQTLDVTRVLSALVGVLLILVVFDIKALNILAIATGAFIVILKDQILSFLGYFYSISVYDIGDDLRIGTVMGEVVRMKPLYIALAGKDETGQYDGILHYVPNYRLMTEYVEELEIKASTLRRIDIVAVYNHTTFPDSFEEWKKKVTNFLDETLPLQKPATVGNFKSFSGMRYQIRFNYNERGEVTAKISFIAKPPKTSEFKEKIISFIESTRKA